MRKNVRIRRYSGLYFPAFRYSVSLRIQSKCRKMRTRITLNTDTSYAVNAFANYDIWNHFYGRISMQSWKKNMNVRVFLLLEHTYARSQSLISKPEPTSIFWHASEYASDKDFKRLVHRKISKLSTRVFCKKAVLKKFTKFIEKYQCWIPIFNKIESLQPATWLKQKLQHILYIF